MNFMKTEVENKNQTVKPHSTVLTYLSILATLLLWASAFPVVRFGLRTIENPGGLDPGPLALLRFSIASLGAITYLLVTRSPLPKKTDLLRFAIAGFFGIAMYHTLFNFGEIMVASGAAAALVALSPVFVALLSIIFFKERLTLWGWLGIVCSTIGVIIIGFVDVSGFTFNIYALALVGSALATATYFVLAKPLLKTYSGMRFTCYSFIAGTIPLLLFTPALLRELPEASPSAFAAVGYLGIFPALVGYALWNNALTSMSASRLAVFLNISPVFAAVIAWLWLGEIPTSLTIIGAIVAIIGVLMVQLAGESGNAT
ncbi:MAG: EamA family transporter [Actinomycetia bacterium]|nr:EamA family transporter [Actinomycetes bacterium]